MYATVRKNYVYHFLYRLFVNDYPHGSWRTIPSHHKAIAVTSVLSVKI